METKVKDGPQLESKMDARKYKLNQTQLPWTLVLSRVRLIQLNSTLKKAAYTLGFSPTQLNPTLLYPVEEW